jgi:hypothetical protein
LRVRKALFITALVLGALVALYAGLGYWVAPRLLVSGLTRFAADRGYTLRVDAVRVYPFRLTASAEGAALSRGPKTLGSVHRATVRLSPSSAWRRSWTIDFAVIDTPKVSIALSDHGDLNWAPLAASSASSAPSQAPRVGVRTLIVSGGTIDFSDRSRRAPVALHVQPLQLEIEDLATFGPTEGRYTLSAVTGARGTLVSRGALSLAPLAARGTVELHEIALATAARVASPTTVPPSGVVRASAAFELRRRQTTLHDVNASVSGFEWALPPGKVELRDIELKIPKAEWPLTGPVAIAASARVTPSGLLTAHGELGVSPLRGKLMVSAADVPLNLAQPWVSQGTGVEAAEGTFGGEGELDLGEPARFLGSIALAGVGVNAKRSGDLLFEAERIASSNVTLELSPVSLHLVEVIATAPHARVGIEERGKVNLSEAFKGDGQGQATGNRLPVVVERVRIENGTLDLTDHSTQPSFSTTVHELSGIVSDLSTSPNDLARVQLDGRVAESGVARIRGAVAIFAPTSRTDLRLRFANVSLHAFTPYVEKFAGYAVESGRLTADLRYHVRDGRLHGDNQLIIEELHLGPRVASAHAKDIPVALAVALLTDSQGRLRLGIPVNGDLRDPKFDIGALLGKAVANTLKKVASAPFRALGSLFHGKDGNLGQVVFQAGSGRLDPAERDKVAQLAKSLAARPRLQVVVTAGYDPQLDARALQLAAARRDVARRAGYEVSEAEEQTPLDLGDPRTQRAAEALFREGGGTRKQLAALRTQAAQSTAGRGPAGEKGRYVRLLLEALGAKVQIAPDQLKRLAGARGQAVQSTLVGTGLAPERVALGAPGAVKGQNQQVALSLVLGASPSERAPGAVSLARGHYLRRSIAGTGLPSARSGGGIPRSAASEGAASRGSTGVA